MGTVGVYVRTGPSRLPRRPGDGHLFVSQDGQLHLLSQRDGIVSCSVCGPVHRMRRRDRVTVSSGADQAIRDVFFLLGCAIAGLTVSLLLFAVLVP